MTVYLERSIRRGITLAAAMPNIVQRARPAVPPAKQPSPGVVASASRMRRMARRSLQLIRPVFAPLLLRLHLRMQTAIDTSVKISQIETAVEAMETRLADIALMISRLNLFHNSGPIVEHKLQELSHKQAAMAETLAQIVGSVDRTSVSGPIVEHKLQELSHKQAAMAETLAQIVGSVDRTSVNEDLLLQRRVVSVGNELLVRSIDGWLLVPVEDLGLVMAMVETAGILEPGTRRIMTKLLAPGSVVIDVGAHIGCLTLAAAHKVGETGHVMAIEPTPRSVDLLRSNVNLNDLSERVTIHACAAGASSRKATLNLSSRLGHNSLLPLPETIDTVEVDVHTVDSLVPAGDRVDLVKIDVEGSELDVWTGMRRVITDNKEIAVIIELGPSHLSRAGSTLSDWLDALCAPGFMPWEINEATASLSPLRPISGLEKLNSINLLLLRGHPSERPGLA